MDVNYNKLSNRPNLRNVELHTSRNTEISANNLGERFSIFRQFSSLLSIRTTWRRRFILSFNDIT